MQKVLVIGPDVKRSRGGMATVISQIQDSPILNSKFNINIFSSYIDGPLPVRIFYSIVAYIRFLTVYNQYDLFHIHNASYGSTFRKRFYLKIIKKAGKPVIAHVHGASYLVFYEGLKEAGKEKVLDYLNGADLVIALSEEWKQKFKEEFHISHIKAIPNGMDPDLYTEAICDPAQYHNSFVLLGRVGERKGIYDVIKAVKLAVKEVPDILVMIAGDGEVDKARELVRQEGLEDQIKILGWVDQKGKMEILKEASTLLLPSYNEGLPMSVLEGMACKKAVISTTVGALPEVIQEDNGVLIQPGNIQALADALVCFCQNPALLKSMGEANRKKIEQEFSLKKMHEDLILCYEDLLRGERKF